MPRLPSSLGSNPTKTMRFDQLQLSELEAYALSHSQSFSDVVRLAVSKFFESEFAKMNNLRDLCELLEWQARKLELVALSERIYIAGTGPSGGERELVAKHEREVLYDQAVNMLHTLLDIAESKEATTDPEVKIDALLAANALTRTAEAIMNDYERSVTKAHLQQMRDFIERLKQASGKRDQGSRKPT